jgi:diacylglycerol kinase family enzyme
VRVLLIINPAASSVTPRHRNVITKALSADHDLEVAETSGRGHAGDLAAMAAASGVDLVVVLGGDGTLNEAASGLVGTDTALTPLPAGSTNVYARTLGYERNPFEAVGQLLDAVDHRRYRRTGVGRANDRLFLFNLGIGFDAAVVERAERRSGLKRYVAHPLYAVLALDTWFRGYDHRHEQFRIELPDGTVIERSFFAIVSKTSPYSYLESRPLIVAPHASLDSALSLTAFRAQSSPRFLLIVSSVARGGKRLGKRRTVTSVDDLQHGTVVSEKPFPYQVDGEYLGETTHLNFTYERDCLRLLVPNKD